MTVSEATMRAIEARDWTTCARWLNETQRELARLRGVEIATGTGLRCAAGVPEGCKAMVDDVTNQMLRALSRAQNVPLPVARWMLSWALSPDPWNNALEARRARAATHTTHVVRDGVPQPYDTAIAQRRAEERR